MTSRCGPRAEKIVISWLPDCTSTYDPGRPRLRNRTPKRVGISFHPSQVGRTPLELSSTWAELCDVPWHLRKPSMGRMRPVTWAARGKLTPSGNPASPERPAPTSCSGRRTAASRPVRSTSLRSGRRHLRHLDLRRGRHAPACDAGSSGRGPARVPGVPADGSAPTAALAGLLTVD